MKTNLKIQVRAFPVKIHNRLTDKVTQDTIVLTKEQLRAAQMVGQSSKELIHRIYGCAGYNVLEIGKTEKREISMNLEELYKLHSKTVVGKREKVDA